VVSSSNIRMRSQFLAANGKSSSLAVDRALAMGVLGPRELLLQCCICNEPDLTIGGLWALQASVFLCCFGDSRL